MVNEKQKYYNDTQSRVVSRSFEKRKFEVEKELKTLFMSKVNEEFWISRKKSFFSLKRKVSTLSSLPIDSAELIFIFFNNYIIRIFQGVHSAKHRSSVWDVLYIFISRYLVYKLPINSTQRRFHRPNTMQDTCRTYWNPPDWQYTDDLLKAKLIPQQTCCHYDATVSPTYP